LAVVTPLLNFPEIDNQQHCVFRFTFFFDLSQGFEDLVAHNLVTFKSYQEALDGWALNELIGHYVNYRKQVSPSMQELLPETNFRLFAVSVNSKGQALAVGAFGVVLKSDDSGASWQSVPPTWTTYSDVGVDPHLYAAQVDEAGALTLAGEFGLILHSTDGGKHWAPEHKGDASIFALQLREDGVGYAVGQSGLVLRTADHGVTWTTLTSGSTAILLGVDALPNGHVVASGMHDMIESKDDGKTWTHVISPDASTSWYEGVGTTTESGSFIAVGHSGRIVDVGG